MKQKLKKKTDEILAKQLKSCERNMQEFRDFNKRPNLRIMGIGEEEGQAKGIHNIFNKRITENFPKLKNILPIQVQETSRTPNRLAKIEPSHVILSLKHQAQRTEKEY
jgi:hypothetical protein